ncbi:MAG TPA: four helix bundle protein [Anaerolineae bacterium]|nr:four helix bundle protein [Anaerolineae bacterium]HQH38573.1 four helix bundle protein [Anaerolineae bacterium]
MEYAEWEKNVHARIKKESIWQFFGYRKALFAYELVWQDCDILNLDMRGKAVAQQLIRSAGSMSANLEEGHGRGYGKQRDWFLKVAIGSARESKGWYWRAEHLLPKDILEQRLALLDEVLALLVTELQRQQLR